MEEEEEEEPPRHRCEGTSRVTGCPALCGIVPLFLLNFTRPANGDAAPYCYIMPILVKTAAFTATMTAAESMET